MNRGPQPAGAFVSAGDSLRPTVSGGRIAVVSQTGIIKGKLAGAKRC